VNRFREPQMNVGFITVVKGSKERGIASASVDGRGMRDFGFVVYLKRTVALLLWICIRIRVEKAHTTGVTFSAAGFWLNLSLIASSFNPSGGSDALER
jgi:hypothetical protein